MGGGGTEKVQAPRLEEDPASWDPARRCSWDLQAQVWLREHGSPQPTRSPQPTHTLDFISRSVRGRVPDNRTHWNLLALLLVPFPCPGRQAKLSGDLLSQLKALSSVPSGWWLSTQTVASATEEWISNRVVSDLSNHTRSLSSREPGESRPRNPAAGPLAEGRARVSVSYPQLLSPAQSQEGTGTGQEKGKRLLSHTKLHSHSHPANVKLVIPFYVLKKYIHLFF